MVDDSSALHKSNWNGSQAAAGSGAKAGRAILYLALAAAIVVAGYAMLGAARDRSLARETQDRLVAYHGLRQAAQKRLAPDYFDKDGNLLADPPSDASQILDPDTLVLAQYRDADADTQIVDWEAFSNHLAHATGKKVISQEYLNGADDVAAMKAGAIHVVALHAADAPYVVNNAGFVPFAVLGTDAGAHGNHLVVAATARSQVKSLDDLRGRSLTCTTPDSITGYRAAISILAEKTSMRPDVDYFVSFSHGQKKSVLGVAAGDYEVAALSDDKLQSLLKKGDLTTADYHVIYESEVIPRLTIGYMYNLKPEIAAQVTAASLAFTNEGGAPDESTGQPMRFYKSDYKRDFEFMRKIDDSFDPRIHKRPKTIPEPAATAPAIESPTAPAAETSDGPATETPGETS